MRYGPDYIRVNFGFDVEPHGHIPTIWRVNGGRYCMGNASTTAPFRYNAIFLDTLIPDCFDDSQTTEELFVVFLRNFFLTYFHEYVHQFIPEKFGGHERTKVDPLAYEFMISYTHTDDWGSWCDLFSDVLTFIPLHRAQRRDSIEAFKANLARQNVSRQEKVEELRRKLDVLEAPA